MTGDLLLDKFQLSVPEPDIYRVGQYKPVSIRDQIVRASFLVERLWSTKRLKRSSKLLVIGAGAAGVTAAVKAVHFGVTRVVVADARDRVLSLQANCTTRWLDPTQYDWPASHWDGEQWPIKEPAAFAFPTAAKLPPVVTLEADYADEWSAKFAFALSVYESAGSVNFVANVKAVDWNFVPAKSCYQVEFDDAASGASKGSLDADLVIFAGGFGREVVSVPLWHASGAGFSRHPTGGMYRSIPFWADDAFETPTFGLSAASPSMLVSGGGDGALQDFIRLVSGQRSAREVWKAVEPALSLATLRAFERLGDWDRNTQDAEEFAPAYGSACDRLAALHARYALELQQLRTNIGEWAAVTAALDALIPSSRPKEKVVLALKSTHFDWCYPLNRLVALLLSEYVSFKHPGHTPLVKRVAVRGVVPSVTLASGGTALGVFLAHNTTCATTNASIAAWPGKTTGAAVDGIVVRHGIDTAALSVRSSKLAGQVVPQHLP